MGLRLAQRIDDLDGLTWACKGVLSQAWPERFQLIEDQARLVARATQMQLLDEGRTEEAAKFSSELKEALAHDVIIRVTWTGDADIDLAVEEPSGTVCSIENLASAGGGTLLGDAFPGSSNQPAGTVSETYICPQGFSGQYRVLIRRVWGNVSTGHATVDIVTDLGRPSERVIRQEVPLTEKDALVVFDVKEGRRNQEIADAQLAQLKDVQQDVRGQILGQVVANPLVGNPLVNGADGDSSQVLSELFRDAQRLGIAGRNPFGLRGGVGFRPEITVLPQGASLSTLAIISADRRYVRITPLPFFSQIGDVTTFNFVTGDTGNGNAPGGGGGGGIGGGGGGGIGGGGGGGIGN
jgi:hypothetical protein